MSVPDNWFKELQAEFPWPDKQPMSAIRDEREVLLGFDAHGWLAGDTRQMIARQFKKVAKPTYIIEIGCWLGLTTRFLLSLHPDVKIICVDHWKGSAEHQPGGRQDCILRLPILFEQFQHNQWKWRDRIILMRGKSIWALNMLFGKEVDDKIPPPCLIHVDGSHAFQDVIEDVRKSLLPFPGAQITGDDWNRTKDVRPAVEKVVKDFKIKDRLIHNRYAWAIEAPQ